MLFETNIGTLGDQLNIIFLVICASYQIRISTCKLWVEVLRSSASTTRSTYDQTGQSYFATNVCFQLATTIWYGQEKYLSITYLLVESKHWLRSCLCPVCTFRSAMARSTLYSQCLWFSPFIFHTS